MNASIATNQTILVGRIYQSEINKKQRTKLAMPVVYYSQLMSVAYGGSAKQAGLDGHIIQPRKLQEIVGK